MFERILDPYERKARLTPALLTVAPVVGVLLGLYGIQPELNTASVALLTSFGVLYVMASIARELGKRHEQRLFASWGGKPSTVILRHRDGTLDPITKARYHAFLSQRIGVPFPTAQQEQQNPAFADERYAAGTKWLLDQTRDPKRFALLLKENIAYGFRRNCLGLKPYALMVAVGSLLWVLVNIGVITRAGVDLKAIAYAPAGACAAIAGSAIAILVWSHFFTEKSVRTAAFSYADMLLRTCDALA